MKKLLYTLIAVSILSLSTGCGTTKPTVAQSAYKVEGLIIASVDVGMQGWSVYVNAGNANQAQVDTVKSAYNDYFDAQQVAKAALMKYIVTGTNIQEVVTANAAVASAEAPILSLLNKYIPKK